MIPSSLSTDADSTDAEADPEIPGHATDERLTLRFVRSDADFPEGASREAVVRFLHRALGRFGDDPMHIARGMADALSPEGTGPGFVLLALDGDDLVGALVMLRTGMTGYVPENLLLYVAVDAGQRGRGIGGRLCRAAAEACEGDVKLHVEHDNPAKRLYERLGFENKYAEMRLRT